MLRLPSLLLALLGVTGCAAAPSIQNPITENTRPALATRFGLALDGRPVTAIRLAGLARDLGARPGMIVVFEQWPEHPPADALEAAPGLAALGESLSAIAASGAIPVVTWEPMYYRAADGAEIILPAASTLDGRYDAYADAFAATLLATPGDLPVVVRLMHEPNLDRYHWGVTRADYDARAPEIYRRLWHHIVGRVRAAAGPEGAQRLRFAFCPNAESVPGPGNSSAHDWNTIAAYYPGADWVDMVGVDGYNWGDTQTPERHGWQSTWRDFADILGPAVTELRALAPGKPLTIFETASAPTGGDKAAWLRAAARAAHRWDVAALCWFEADKEVDWRLATALPPGADRDFVRALGAAAEK